MARTPLDPTAFMDAWKTMHYGTIHEAAKKEASRQVNELDKWMKWQISHDPDMMKEIHAEKGVFELIRKARRYRDIIYDRNKRIAEAPVQKMTALKEGRLEDAALVGEKVADMEDDQWRSCRRILKIYCAVRYMAGGTLELTEPEEIEYEYDPEES